MCVCGVFGRGEGVQNVQIFVCVCQKQVIKDQKCMVLTASLWFIRYHGRVVRFGGYLVLFDSYYDVVMLTS